MERSYQQGAVQSGARAQEIVGPFMRRVYNWMAGGLGLSAALSWVMVNSPAVLGLFFQVQPTPAGLQVGAPKLAYWGVLIAVFGLVIGLSAGIQKIKVGTAATLFILYAALNGVFIAPLLLIYTSASVFKAFLITAGTFGVTSLWASTTKKDLSGMGSFLFMGLIGLVIAMVVNMFFGSPMIDWIISVVGVGLFVGLTAYDTQQLRAMVLQAANQTTVSKMAIFGALKLYLDFLNLFIMLLRLFGERR
jgi:hypothetical protein